ncbi:MAG TPA: SMP-30/gluconolactonase/LRE family protein [Ilumatobacter sp.]|nr:SMP-30/gluconolactonase/LRE family protein [Ilumatobacter sp.]
MDRELNTLFAGGTFFEGPRWHDGRWWVSDFYSHRVLAIDEAGGAETMVTLDGQPSGLGWMPDGSLLVVSMKDHLIMRRHPNGDVAVHADISSFCGGHANDMVVDAKGRAFVGNFGFDLMGGESPALASLVRVDSDGSVALAASEMFFPNGSVILPDEQTLIVGETLGCRYTAFTIEEDGSLSDRRVWAQLAPTPAIGTTQEVMAAVTVAPDGCGLDADGCIWAADAVGSRVIRVASGGDILDSIPMPDGLGAFACQLGGSNGSTLLICAAPDFFEHARQAATEAVLFTVDVGVQAAGRP